MDSCCEVNEWPLDPQRGGAKFFAYAAFFTQRAHLAKESK
jgi:hypothetical protein